MKSAKAVDGLIAATAIEHGLTMVTRNVKDFERLQRAVVNPRGISFTPN